jgi:hypothetical protein
MSCKRLRIECIISIDFYSFEDQPDLRTFAHWQRYTIEQLSSSHLIDSIYSWCLSIVECCLVMRPYWQAESMLTSTNRSIEKWSCLTRSKTDWDRRLFLAVRALDNTATRKRHVASTSTRHFSRRSRQLLVSFLFHTSHHLFSMLYSRSSMIVKWSTLISRFEQSNKLLEYITNTDCTWHTKANVDLRIDGFILVRVRKDQHEWDNRLSQLNRKLNRHHSSWYDNEIWIDHRRVSSLCFRWNIVQY